MRNKSRMVIASAAMLLGMASITGCVASTVVDEIERSTATMAYESKGENYQMGTLYMQIMNNAENTALFIDSIEVCNIMVRNNTTGTAQKGDITAIKHSINKGSATTINLNYQAQASSGAIQLLPQALIPWNTSTIPTNISGSYAKIHGSLYTHLANGELLEIFKGAIYTPLQGSIISAGTTTITIQIHPDAPLYCIKNDKVEPVLQTINFDVTIDEWETIGTQTNLPG